MSREKTVLSLNADGRGLTAYESALREDRFEVISVRSPLEARFEIEMARCGILLINYITSLSIYRNLAELFRQYCQDGLIAYVARPTEDDLVDAEILMTENDEPRVLLEKLNEITGRTV